VIPGGERPNTGLAGNQTLLTSGRLGMLATAASKNGVLDREIADTLIAALANSVFGSL
jgi:hypothetical protein